MKVIAIGGDNALAAKLKNVKATTVNENPKPVTPAVKKAESKPVQAEAKKEEGTEKAEDKKKDQKEASAKA